MDPISFGYIVLYDDGEVGTINSVVTLHDGLSFAAGHDIADDDVQDRQYLKTFALTDHMLWIGHRGLNLDHIILAFPIIPDKHVENPEAYRLLDAQLGEETFHPLLLAMQIQRQELTIPGYGPTSGRHPFGGETILGYIDIQGILLNTTKIRDILVVDCAVELWAETRKRWIDRSWTDTPPTSE